MNETQVTFQGWVGSEVALNDVGSTQVASFRVGTTPRRFRDGHWEDGQTAWFTVKAWRGLAHNVSKSLRTGDAVVITGRLEVDVWKRDDGSTSTRHIVVATSIGHDLTKGSTIFTKAPRQELAPEEGLARLQERVHSFDDEGPLLDHTGEVRESAPHEGSDGGPDVEPDGEPEAAPDKAERVA